MADYHYVSTWQLQAPIERVWAAISDLDQLPGRYPAVNQVQTLAPGGDQGVGARVRYGIKGRLPMRLAFEVTITRVDPHGSWSCGPRGSWPGPAAGCWTSKATPRPSATCGMCARPSRG